MEISQMRSMTDDVAIIAIPDIGILPRIRSILLDSFGNDDLWHLHASEYHRIVARAQDILNGYQLAQHIARSVRGDIAGLLGSDDIMVQSNLYLRAARPQPQESVGWHRESFYGCQPQALNVWIPVLNVTPENAIRYVPGSAVIPDERIVTEADDPGAVEKGSNGHKIGLLYAPKRIVGGVDFSTARAFDVPSGSLAVFSSQLIHGAAENRTDHIRFSIDFRVIAAEHVDAQKQHFASGGQNFFVPLEIPERAVA